jgi:hypothetical protein
MRSQGVESNVEALYEAFC